MKLVRVISLFLFTILFCTSYAHESKSFLQQQNKGEVQSVLEKVKTYIQSADVILDGKDIYVLLNQEWVQTRALFSDSKGMYIVDSQGVWRCGRCGYDKNSNLWSCEKCGKRRNDFIEQ